MQDFQRQFIEFAIQTSVLCFGDFTLKSGRQSPYFFNSGLFNDGASLKRLGEFYRQAVDASGLQFDMLFGPAYKGIPLATALAVAYADSEDRALPYCFDRKEVKDHGEGGTTLGAPLQGRVLLVDDVITAGTSVRHCHDIIKAAGARPEAIIIALDRQEKGQGQRSAIQEIEQELDMQVISIIRLEHLVEFLEDQPEQAAVLAAIQRYRQDYGAS